MGEAFISRRGGGSGGIGDTLTIMAPAGCTVTVSKDGKTKTKVAGADGVAVFKGLATGDWMVTITDGTRTTQKTVPIAADYTTDLCFSKINVTFPAGFVCTATDGVTTLTAPDTSGTWECYVPNGGVWTLTLDNGLMNRVEAEDGGTYTVNRWYLCKDGLMASGIQMSNQLRGEGSNAIVSQESDHVSVSSPTGVSTGILSNEMIDLTGFATVIADLDITAQGTSSTLGKFKGVGLILADSTENSSTSAAQDAIKHETLSTQKGRQTISIDASSVTGSWYIGFALGYILNVSGAKLKMYNLYVE